MQEQNLTSFYNEIWRKSAKKSQLSGEPLSDLKGTKMFRSCFAHILPKGMNQFPYFKFYKNNIFLLTPDEHHLFDNGTKEQREKYAKDNNCSWDILYQLEFNLKEVYHSLFPAKVGPMIMKYSKDEVAEIINKLNDE